MIFAVSLWVALAAAASDPTPDPAAQACPKEMAAIPGGRFKLAERGDEATVKPFCLDVTEVTVAAHEACAKSGACKPASTTENLPEAPPAAAAERSKLCNAAKAERRQDPLNCVSWDEAAAHCAAVGKRLPTEEEWEWAARGASRGTAFPWGDEEPDAQLCWNRNPKGQPLGTCPVGAHPKSDTPQGVKDLAGNVWEWTSSRDDCGRAEQCPIRRGGGWSSKTANRVNAGVRMGDQRTQRQTDIGFRCAR